MAYDPGLHKRLGENVRFRLWSTFAGVEDRRERWAAVLAELTGWPRRRVEVALDEEDYTEQDVRHLAEVMDITEAEMRLEDFAAQEDTLVRNTQYLLSSMAHGAKAGLAEVLKVDPTTLSRWNRGVRPRRAEDLAGIRAYFAIDATVDLEVDRIYLSFQPVTLTDRRRRLIEMIEHLPHDQLGPLLPALEKLLRPR